MLLMYSRKGELQSTEEMVKLKPTPQRLVASPETGTITKNGDENLQRKTPKSIDHWAFLNEIEAPMWVDLALECESNYQDKGDDWFHTNHPFHQYSSQELISAFPLSGQRCANLGFGSSSPKLPPSVSRSRGIHCKSMKSNKLHPVKNLSLSSSSMNSRSDKAVKGKPIQSDGKLEGLINSNSGLCYQENSSKSSSSSRGENYSTSITSKTTAQRSSSGLLSSVMQTSQAPTYRSPSVQARDSICKSKQGVKQKASKEKVVVPRRFNGRAPLSTSVTAKKIVGAASSNRTNDGGKENVNDNQGLSMKSRRREHKAGPSVKEKSDDQRKVKKCGSMIETTYFR